MNVFQFLTIVFILIVIIIPVYNKLFKEDMWRYFESKMNFKLKKNSFEINRKKGK